jgi:hypothetical protein
MSIRVRICQVSTAVLLLHSWGTRAEEPGPATAEPAPAEGVSASTPPADERKADSTSPPVESPRALNSHVFQPSRLVTGPFVATAFGMATFAGEGTVDAPRYGLTLTPSGVGLTQVGTKQYTLATYGQALNADFSLTPDIGLRFEVTAIVFSGTNARGLLVAGATAQTGFSAGVTAGKNLTRELRLSFVGDFGVEPQYSLLIGNAISAAAQSGRFDDTGLTEEVNRLRAAPGVSLAWAPFPWFGLIAEAKYIWSRRISSQDSSSQTLNGASWGGLLSLDLDPLLHWPFGFQAAYQGAFPMGDNGIPEIQQVSAGVYYTRRVRLALGLEFIYRHGDVRPGVTPTLTAESGTAAIQFRYYW